MPDLVQDLARLHVADRVVPGRLERREPPQGAFGELRVATDRVHRHDQRVAPEHRHVPRHAGGGDDHPALEGRVLETERLEVPDRLGPGAADGLVRALDAHGGEAVDADLRDRARPPSCTAAPPVVGPRPGRVIGSQLVHACHVPLAAISATNSEASVGVLRARVGPLHLDHQLPPEVAVRVGRPELAPAREPARVHGSASDDGAGPDVEDVREVRLQLDLDHQANGPAGVVDDVDVLVHPAGHRAIEPDRQRLAWDRAHAVEQVVVGELVARREEPDRRGVEQDRPAAVEPQRVARHEAGVAGEESVVAEPGDRGVRLADEHPVVPVHRDRRRADLDRKGHRGTRVRTPW